MHRHKYRVRCGDFAKVVEKYRKSNLLQRFTTICCQEFQAKYATGTRVPQKMHGKHTK